VEVYCDCRQCPAFVQFGTGNLISCSVVFNVELDGNTVKSVTRTSPDTDDWVRDEPRKDYMKRGEGPMSYDAAQRLHRNYTEERPAQRAEFHKWAQARSMAYKAGKPWPFSLNVGEYPEETT
jgi:hypothetical protein